MCCHIVPVHLTPIRQGRIMPLFSNKLVEPMAPNENLRKAARLAIGPKVNLRLLATSDLHAHVLSWDYDKHQVAPARGLSRVATLIAAARSESENTLLLDNGDFLNGSGLGDHIVAQSHFARTHPMVGAMNQLRYDAVAIGNHELSHGTEFFRGALANANFPVICSNFIFDTLKIVQPYAMLERQMRDTGGNLHDLKIGVIGLLPAQTMVWEGRHLTGVAQPLPMVATAQRLAQTLRDMGADIVVALTHSGMGEQSSPNEETAAVMVAAIDGIDAVVAGHTHEVFPQPARGAVKGTALVMPGFFGSHLGVIDLQLEKTAAGWQRLHSKSETRAISYRPKIYGLLEPIAAESPEIVAIAMADHLNIVAASDVVIGHSDVRLHSYFALVADSAALHVVARAQEMHLRARLLGGPYAGIPVLCAVAPFKSGGRGGPENYTDLHAGKLRIRHASDLYAHPNQLVGFSLSGGDVRAWLERSVSLFHQIAPGQQDAALVDDDFPSFNFDVIFGLTYQIDLAQPARFDAKGQVANPNAARICNLRYQGQAVTDNQRFILASNSYRIDGNIGFAGATSANIVNQSDAFIRDILRDHMMQTNLIADIDPARWGFCPLPNTSVILQSSPLAADLLDELPHLRLDPLERLETGFQRFRLQL